MTESTGQRPTLAVVLNRDLLFGSRIRSALKSLGLDARFVTTAEQFVGALREQPQVGGDRHYRHEWRSLLGRDRRSAVTTER